MIKSQLVGQGEGKISKLGKRGIVNDDFSKQAADIKRKIISSFIKSAAELVIDDSGWGDQVYLHENELAHNLDLIIKNMREKEIDKLQNLTTKATYDTIEEIVSGPIFELNDNFWEEIREPYTEEIKAVLQNCGEILKNGFSSDQNEQEEFM